MNNFKNQILYVWQDRLLRIICLVLPLILGFLVYSIFYAGLPRDLPIGILDQDNSALSTDISFSLETTPTLKVTHKYSSINAAKDDLSDGKIYGLVVIPANLERNAKMGIKTKIPFYYNNQFVLIGKALEGAFLQVSATIDAKTDMIRGLVQSSNLNIAISQAMPIISEMYALYNPNNDYSQFLLTLILPCMWQILTALGMLNLIKKAHKTKEVLVGLVINVAIFSFWGMGMLVFFQALGYPMKGSYCILLLGVLMLSISISGMVVCFESILKDLTKTVSVITAYTAPSLAFAGITYPQSNMEGFSLFWSHILPISYFMKIYLQQANYGIDMIYSFKILFEMLPFLLFLCLGILVHNLRGSK